MVDGERIAWAGAIENTKRATTPADTLRAKYLFNELVPKSRENIEHVSYIENIIGDFHGCSLECHYGFSNYSSNYRTR